MANSKKEQHYQKVEKIKERWRNKTLEELEAFKLKFPGGITGEALKKALNQLIEEKKREQN